MDGGSPFGPVVSNANLLGTIFHLVGPEQFRPDFVEQARAVRLNNSGTQVYLALRPGEMIDESECGDLMFSSPPPSSRTDLLLSPDITSRAYSFYYPKTRPGHDRCMVVASTNAQYHDWADLSPADYQVRKRELIESTIEATAKYVPRFDGSWTEPRPPRPSRSNTTQNTSTAPISARSMKGWPSAEACPSRLPASTTWAAWGLSCRVGWAR